MPLVILHTLPQPTTILFPYFRLRVTLQPPASLFSSFFIPSDSTSYISFQSFVVVKPSSSLPAPIPSTINVSGPSSTRISLAFHVEVEADFNAFEEFGDEGNEMGAEVGVDEDNDHDVNSAVEEVAASTLQICRQRQTQEAQRERERDIETDVELPAGPSGIGSGGRPRRSGHGRNLSAQMNPMELIRDQEEADGDDDVDMVDASEHAEGMGIDEDFDDEVEFVDPAGEEDGLEGRSDGEEMRGVQGGPAGAKRKG
ncbi:hypothetical protein BT96DRAFT_1003296 [Gymnopus androsaceus JB14]|uniref:Histone chaperone domain-containing protein n=1 Tax=Gymnopus androsaceus JB14 TaxID=1447944 RepID=A0A6A4GVA3_9AGAR|nr:hypothetical protein BT96DRAFT_1003296 [Gymnopus androsaceus JB14]